MKQCPRCASEVAESSKVCPRCGLPTSQMQSEEVEESVSSAKLNRAQKKEKKRLKKAEKKEQKRLKKIRESRSDTDFSKYATNAAKTEDDIISEDDQLLTKRKKLKKAKEAPKFELDENGEFNIDTKDVELVGEEVGKIIEERHQQTYSIKKARGDYRPPKVKWWELYKLADRSFARRKIKKEVVKASKIKPSFISKAKLLCLAIFLGWTGAHNFYAKNKRKGWVSVVSLVSWVGIIWLARSSKFFASIEFSIAGFAGFVCLIIWFSDIINIIFNNFKYRIQSDEFIFNMNVETRAKLGEKYIDLDLYQKPWWVKFKVWCQKLRRNYAEWKHDRRQRMIEKEKARIAAEEEQAKIDAEIARAEAKESEKIAAEKKQDRIAETKKHIKENKLVEEVKAFEKEDGSDDSKEDKPQKPKKATPSKKAKVVAKKKTNSKKK